MIHNNISVNHDVNDYYQKVYLNSRCIGEYDPSNKAFITLRSQIFRKYNGFGVPSELLEDERFLIDSVEVHYQGITFSTEFKRFRESQMKYEFTNSTPSETLYFVSITDFAIKD